MIDLGSLPFQIVGKLSSRLYTTTELESELHDRFGNNEWEINTYNDKKLTVSISSIRVRPRIDIGGELKEPTFAWGNNWREDPSTIESARAILFNDWLTAVRFSIEQGDITDLHPDGLNLGYATAISSSVVAMDENEIVTRMVRISDEPDVFSPKLVTRIPFTGSVAQYSEEISKAVDTVQYVQQNIDQIAFQQLMNMYSITDQDWRGEDRAKKLSQFLFGYTDLQKVERVAAPLKTEENPNQGMESEN